MAKVKLLDPSDPRRKLDRYELIGEIATGGMATVFLARRGGVGGFQRFVAIKRLHPHLANEPEFVEMFLDEARLAALIHHPNVVPILEVGETEAGYYLVMEYVEGDTLSKIVARSMSLGQLPPRHVILRMVLDALAGLHAAHELRDDRGHLLGLVHRDCSPQNVLVGVDGTARITDFGVARASSRLTSTAHGKLKGKLAYMAPEQTRGDELDRRTDLFAMGVIVWEVLCGKRLFKADSEAATLQRILVEPIRPPSEVNGAIPKCFDPVVLKALDRNQDKRFQTAADMIDALEAAAREAAKMSVTDVGVASPREVASFVQAILGQEIGAQRESVRAWLAQSDSGQPVVIGGSQPPGGRDRLSSNPPRSSREGPPPQRLSDSNDGLPSTQIDPAVALARSPVPLPAGQGGKPSPLPVAAQGTPVIHDSGPKESNGPVHVPQFEVAADVTMRFALEQPKPEPPPPPVSPPRAPPPARQSQRTLIGQGPAPRTGAEVEAAAAQRLDGASTQKGLGLAQAVAEATGGLPKDAATVKEGAGGYVPQIEDDLEDVVTVARPHAGPSAAAMTPAVKTARGLFAEPLLAEARARLEANGHVFEAGANGTQRMISAGEAGVSPDKIQAANAALGAGLVAAGHAASGQAGSATIAASPIDGAAIVGAVPAANGVAGLQPAGSSKPPPRTLVSSTGEVSAGGFTPGSMTLSAEAAMRADQLDPTIVHAVPKRGYGKYIVVVAAFLIVFGTGLVLMKSKYMSSDARPDDTTQKTARPATTSEKTATPNATTTATASSTPTASESSANDAASATASAKASNEPSASASVATSGQEHHASSGGRRTPKSGGTSTPGTSQPLTPPPPPPPSPTEDLSNPYR